MVKDRDKVKRDYTIICECLRLRQDFRLYTLLRSACVTSNFMQIPLLLITPSYCPFDVYSATMSAPESTPHSLHTKKYLEAVALSKAEKWEECIKLARYDQRNNVALSMLLLAHADLSFTGPT